MTNRNGPATGRGDATVRHDITMHVVSASRGRTGVLIPGRLEYAAVDPYAVRLTFVTGSATGASEVAWVFARDLLADGMRRRTGDGDVTVRPGSVALHGPDAVLVELSVPEGEAVVALSADAVRRFVEAGWALVPPGGESEAVDVDLLLSRLLVA